MVEKMISIKTNEARRAILHKSLEEIENLGAPRHIELVSAVVGMELVDFAKLGPVKMSALIQLELRTVDKNPGEKSVDMG
jgi:hypothetical protein